MLVYLLLKPGERRYANALILIHTTPLLSGTLFPAAPFEWPVLLDHSSTSSSDRKSWIVAQVKPISFHQSAARTTKWTTPSAAI